MMFRASFQHALSAVLVTAALTGTATAATVTPSSYTYDQSTACGTWCYHDPANSKLTDGVLGLAGWAVNAGNEWDGWVYQNRVNIDFDFGTSRHIDLVRVGTTQDNLGDVVLPSIELYISNDKSTWTFVTGLTVPPDSAHNIDPFSTAPHDFLTLAGLGIDARYVRVGAIANGPWIFVDEVQFQSRTTQPVPEPAALGLLAAGLASLAGTRRPR